MNRNKNHALMSALSKPILINRTPIVHSVAIQPCASTKWQLWLTIATSALVVGVCIGIASSTIIGGQ